MTVSVKRFPTDTPVTVALASDIPAETDPTTQYWQRASTTLSPLTSGDSISTTGLGTFGNVNVTDVGYEQGGSVILQCPSASILLGLLAGDSTTNSDSDIYIGNYAGSNSDGGYYLGGNIGIGYQALKSSSSGVSVAIGINAGYQTQLLQSVMIGQNAGACSTGDSCLAIGSNAMQGSSSFGGVIIGACTNAYGDYCVNIGQGQGTVYNYDISIGNGNSVCGDYVTMIGIYNYVQESYVTAIGIGNYVPSSCGHSVLIGESLSADSPSQIVLGVYNSSAGACQTYLKMTADNSGTFIHYNFPYMPNYTQIGSLVSKDIYITPGNTLAII
jgi:hypothetical protein